MGKDLEKEAAKSAVGANVRGGQKRDKRNTPYYDVKAEDGSLICRVADYKSVVIEETDGVGRLLDYLKVFEKEREAGKWGGFLLDSVSFMTLNARKWHQYELNPDTNNPLQWYGGATDLVEEIIGLQLPGLACHVGASFHVHRRTVDADGEKQKAVRQPFVPGARLVESKMIAAAWPEFYHLYTRPGKEEGTFKRYLQTECSAKYQAGTLIGMPNDIPLPRKLPEDFLWQGWKGKGVRPEIHLAVYSDPHVGKSMFLAQLFQQLCRPLPFYVALFDARGKDMAYRLLGEVQ